MHATCRGDLDAFGRPGIEVDLATDGQLAGRLAASCDLPLLEERLDHGAVVPLRLRDWNRPVVILTMGEGAERAELDRLADRVAICVTELDHSVALVASVNGAAGLSTRAPLTERPGARRAEERLLEALETDVGEVVDLAGMLAADGGSCGYGPLRALGSLLSGTKMEVLAHEEPVGVGYLVAHTI